MTDKTHTIDASGKILGRIASQAAILLRGKNRASYQPYKMPEEKVIITNAEKIRLSGTKASYMKYKHYTGYPGGLREIPFQKLFDRDPRIVIRRTILGMLPRNRQRSRIIKNLTIYNGNEN